MRVTIKVKGDFKNSEKFFNGAITKLPSAIRSIFAKYGQMGVEALRTYTPQDTGETANSWSYEIHNWGISWNNSKNIGTDAPLAILIQYGHGTRNGGYVQGIDYINPALRPIFDQIADECWKEVQSL